MKKIFALALTLTIVISITACSANSNNSNGEKAADTYIAAITALYDSGVQYDTDGLANVASYMYGTSAASVCAMRYAVDCLLYMKGEGSTLEDVVGGRLMNWDEIAALGYASPYPYVFEGIVNEADGKAEEAKNCYANAARNPNLLENSENMKLITLMDKAGLKKIKEKLVALEDKIFAVYEPPYSPIPRNENNFSAAYLREQGRTALTGNPDNYNAALDNYLAALLVDPYDGDNYAGCALLYIYMEDGQSAIRYINDGVFIDPDNKSLATVEEMLKGVIQ